MMLIAGLVWSLELLNLIFVSHFEIRISNLTCSLKCVESDIRPVWVRYLKCTLN